MKTIFAASMWLVFSASVFAGNFPPTDDTFRLASHFVVLESEGGTIINIPIEYGERYYGRAFDTKLLDDMRAECEEELGEPCAVTFFSPVLIPRN